MRTLVVFLWCCFICIATSYCQPATDIGATSHWLFGTDSLIQIKWRIPNTGYTLAAWSDDYFLVAKYESDSTDLLVGRIANGESIWRASVQGWPKGWAIREDTLKRQVVWLEIEDGDTTIVQSRDILTGALVKSRSAFKPRMKIPAGFCPIPPPSDTLWFFATSRVICSLSPDLVIMWQVALNENERLSASGRNSGLLRAPKAIRLIDKKTGVIKWERSYSARIGFVTLADPVRIKFEDGKTEYVDVQTGQPTQPKK